MKKICILILSLLSFFSLFAQNHRDSIDVLHYNINLSIIDFSSKQIDGYTYINLSPYFDNTKTIKLDLEKLHVKTISANNKKIDSWYYDDSVITINFKKSLNKNDTVNLAIFYYGSPIKDASWGGFYFSSKDAFNMGIGMSSIPHSFGRVWFPCNDNFTDKASYEYNITVNKSYIVACGGVQIDVKTSSKDKNLSTFCWKQNNIIPTYLASIDIANYFLIKDQFQAIERTIPIEIFSYSYNVANTKKTFVNLKSAMQIFENLFGPYAWDKIGFSQVSFAQGAMEHAENIAMASFAFDGTTNNETLLYHELSHSWFGNLVTCKTAEDMWLNEGWASYAEALFTENMYGQEKFLEYNRLRHFEVLFYANKIDHGYRALANMDLNYTYGTTIYKKGADVVHTLRNYIGDSLFFPAVRFYLQKYAFSNASTEDLKNTLSEKTGINLNDFFDFWVYSSGFPFFEITNWETVKNADNYDVSVKIKQKLIATNETANSNRINIFFMNNDFKIVKKTFLFSGDSALQTFSIPFSPTIVLCDLYEQTADATLDKFIFISQKNSYKFQECLFDAEIENVTDSSFLRVTCNCIEPESTMNNEFILQKNYYWTIEGIWNKDFEAKGRFYITKLMDLNFRKYPKEKIIMLFRKSSSEKWNEINSKLKDNFLETELYQGQYALAIKI